MNEKLSIVKVLGTGAALSPNLTNTSFSLLDGQILVDCGYNIFSHLYQNEKEILNNLKYIFITHCHADHMGSLESLIYYNEFIRKKPLTVYMSKDTFVAKFIKIILNGKTDYTLNISVPFDYTSFRILTGINTYPLKNYEFLHCKINDDIIKIIANKIPSRQNSDNDYVDFVSRIYSDELALDNSKIFYKLSVNYITRQNHFGSYLNTSYIFKIDFHDFSIVIGISGDMKADIVFEKAIRGIIETCLNVKRYIVFHDCKDTRLLTNVHATKFDMEQIYSEEFRNHIINVHNNKDPEIRELIYNIEEQCLEEL